ncbi:L-serine ammonia-lyase [Verrucomicrobiaceae bacterium N1E253]|uniref:L-serine dehydratase n=1 Tax=Oceaniferula marina TaxID=2748318 RepID=A0A851GB94_9BACT|nr:L-serine ammonia-lyase [Oceaniferula marina]NWK54439.1 L-serine ammonia-lyase [Oceaniferula marina]
MISILDLFSIGIGPSSSHTVGPMRAACQFVKQLVNARLPKLPVRIQCDLYGSLAATGKGHGTDTAIILGLMGNDPETIDVKSVPTMLDAIRKEKKLLWHPQHRIAFEEHQHIVYHSDNALPLHPNGMHLCASSADGDIIMEEVYYSVGGGFIATDAEMKNPHFGTPASPVYPFRSADELTSLCDDHQISIPELMLANENRIRPETETLAALDRIWETMQECVQNGCSNRGVLPGGLNVERRAYKVHQKLANHPEAALSDPLSVIDWVNLYALAVNEENAAGGRVVTAPTNGAAGIIPAVLHYATRFRHSPHGPRKAVHRFLLTAGAIATLYKRNASISGADVGCQGEVGVACSMAAGALVDYLGGDHHQVENAAEIAMEHNLGLTCDPIAGLVQIPCIERNAMGAVKAINASRIARSGDGTHFVSLDKVISTMKETGKDMQEKYKETSRGGLAVNVVEC